MEPTFRDYLATVSKRRWLLAVVLLLVVGSAAVATAATTPKYEAEAKLFVGQQQFAVSEVAEGVQAAQLSVQLLRSYAQILQTRPMAERAVEKEGIDISPAQLAHAIKAEPIPETQLIRLAYRSTDAAEAQLVVNTVSDVFTEEIQRLQKPTQGEPAIQVRVVEPALRPEEPVSPSAVRNLALALVL
ncbi:MAG TPA: Wzz/FepE/Etk N-terminal domain-containing protein, partial [Actinomycetota bacterium]|nr:Wzz/FepE/Etk N-terminal domain-containing protein [Actinomycetota bacterium]